MERSKKLNREPNPRKNANILSIVTFVYTIPTFRKGYRKDLEEEDITEHLKDHDSKLLGDRLEEAWKKELTICKRPSLWRATGRVFGPEFIVLGLFVIVLDLGVKITQPLALTQLIKYFTQKEPIITKNEAYMYAGIIVGASFLHVMIGHSYMMKLQHFGMKLRVAYCSVVYRKSLRLSKSVFGGTTIGQMVNLLSNDVSRCDRAVYHAHNLWVAPMQTVVIIILLYQLVGLASTIGVLFLILFIPLQMYLGKKTSVFRLRTALKTDERVRLMNEIISGIQVIKMYTWEKPFAKLVAIVRRMEIRHVRATSYIRGLLISFTIFTSRFAIFLTILTYVLLNNSLTAEYVFIITSFYNMLRDSMTMFFPRGISDVAELNISVSRLQKFLLLDEIQREDIKTEKNNEISKKNIEVRIENAWAKWSSASSDHTLQSIDFRAQPRQLMAIIGLVGSGKTSLLHLILKELPVEMGSVDVVGKLSYAAQEPWVFAGSVRQNILFGQPMVEERYQEVIRVCALERDLLLLPHADETLVGERGVALSGGQRARVNLARAIYKEADIYLLDDPLSAVDTHVGKQLFDDCISGFLKNKCTILVTHQLQYLQNATQIFLMENGKIAASGSYQELKTLGASFTKQFEENNEEEAIIDDVETKKECLVKYQSKKDDAPKETKEHKSAGSISGDVYMSYFKAGGSVLVGLVVAILFVLTQLSASASDYFLAYWVNLEQAQSVENLSRETCIYIYSGIIASMVVITLLRSFAFFKYCMTASTRLHDDMFSNIVRASMHFFNTNSSGRILNRFSKDMGAIDELLPIAAIDCVQVGLIALGITVVISIVNPWILIVTAIILIVFYSLRVVYMSTSRSVKRLEGTTRSPVFAHISASLQGLTTIRAFEAQAILQKEFDDHQDLNSSICHLFYTCSRAFGFWLDLICVVYIAAVTFSFLLMDTAKQFGGDVGLAITQAMSLTGMLQWGMRQWTELENQMTSVERVVEYTQIEHEVSPHKTNPSPLWPEEGHIDFVSVWLRYSQFDPYVLKGLNFSVKSKEKIGIVGRTGAGKSSLIYALFQLTPIEGGIVIDNIDITKIPLNSLRSKISIIPQEPVLFSGTLRKNLDPFDEYPDVNIWTALEEVELKTVVADLPSGLSHNVSEGGSNFSVGQRQLLCLARAIIRKNRILVMDEATANVDPQTDALIQKTIRRKFAECTVLTIAHRLHTVMDSDKVLVMDAGNAVEFDHPHVLLRNEKGLFYALVQQTGSAMAESLTKVANDNHQERLKIK